MSESEIAQIGKSIVDLGKTVGEVVTRFEHSDWDENLGSLDIVTETLLEMPEHGDQDDFYLELGSPLESFTCMIEYVGFDHETNIPTLQVGFMADDPFSAFRCRFPDSKQSSNEPIAVSAISEVHGHFVEETNSGSAQLKAWFLAAGALDEDTEILQTLALLEKQGADESYRKAMYVAMLAGNTIG